MFIIKYSWILVIHILLHAVPVEMQDGNCFFNTCEAVLNYCQNGGQCVFNETECSTTCICPEKFSGKRCDVLNSKSDGQDKVSSCLINPCSNPLAALSCENGGSCAVDEDTCDFTCICVEGYSGRRCEKENSSINSSTLCLTSGLPCFNGVCISNLTRDTDGSETPTEICSCHAGWTGNQCETKANGDEKIPLHVTTIDTSSSFSIEQTTEPVDPRFNACSMNYTERSDAEKTCNGMFWGHECINGKCRREIQRDENWHGYTYVCDCDDGAQGTYCDFTCCLDCGEHGQCALFEYPNLTLSEHCDCMPNYVGERCETFVPKPFRIQLEKTTWYLYVVGACAVMLVLLIVLAVVIPYMMWKHRVILVMKIVHYFKAYEDDDDRQWDAFVSYKADEADESFVVHTLYPKLEKELGFKLCLHFRDFVPGETIANNIINAVEGSRRTILILTPRYVESEFTRFEYEKAQQEMLRRKHRIIPLLLEDISGIASNMDKTLKNIVESVTYLEWPEVGDSSSKKMDKFWKRLQLSMPKKKELSNSAPNSPSTASASTISTIIPSDCFFDSVKSSEGGGIISHDKFFQSNISTNKTKSDALGVSDINKGGNSYGDESEETLYSEISEIDITLTDMIPTLSEEQEAELCYA